MAVKTLPALFVPYGLFNGTTMKNERTMNKPRKAFTALLAIIAAFITLAVCGCPNGTTDDDPLSHAPADFVVTSSAEWASVCTAIATFGNNHSYIIEIDGDVAVPGSTTSTFGTVTGLTVTLRGYGRLRLSSVGSLVRIAANQTICISGITLKGMTGNNQPLVYVDGTNAVLELQSGSITENSAGNHGAGVWVANSGRFKMSGGAIIGNTSTGSQDGGGVYVVNGSSLTLSGGSISGNTANNGGGVCVNANSSLTMSGGTISNNIASLNGGGVTLLTNNDSFTLSGGSISNNTAGNVGGGVCVYYATHFNKTGGVIYGAEASNTANTASANMSGHAVLYMSPSFAMYYRDTTLAAGQNISTGSTMPTSGTLNGWTKQ